MAVHAEPIPLQGPLPGGSEGATLAVEPLLAGEMSAPRAALEREPGALWRLRARGFRIPREQWLWMPVLAFLARHPVAGPILIDTGLHPSVAVDPRANLGRRTSRFHTPRLGAGQDVPSRLRARGLNPAEVGVVVFTHLHPGHASAISEFPESTLVVSAEEWAAATAGRRSARRGYRRSHFDHAFDYVTVDFDSEAIDSYGPFGRTFDLLGDGSVRLAFTPGHTAGHMSVILRLPRRDFIVAGDSIYTWSQLQGGPGPPRMEDEHNWSRSLRELQLYHQQYPHSIIVPGHDPEFFAQLEDRYEE